jgi:hypothetical protein
MGEPAAASWTVGLELAVPCSGKGAGFPELFMLTESAFELSAAAVSFDGTLGEEEPGVWSKVPLPATDSVGQKSATRPGAGPPRPSVVACGSSCPKSPSEPLRRKASGLGCAVGTGWAGDRWAGLRAAVVKEAYGTCLSSNCSTPGLDRVSTADPPHFSSPGDSIAGRGGATGTAPILIEDHPAFCPEKISSSHASQTRMNSTFSGGSQSRTRLRAVAKQEVLAAWSLKRP